MKLLSYLIILCAFILISLSPLSAAVGGSIAELRLTPQFIRPDRGESALINYTLNQPGSVSIYIRDEAGDPVSTLVREQVQSAGDHVRIWYGRDDRGEPLPESAYYITIDLSGEDGMNETAPRDNRFVSRPVEMTDFSFNPDTGIITYSLDKPARVFIRAGILGGGPLLAQILNWEVRPAGENKELWEMNYGERMVIKEKELSFSSRFEVLPENCIIITGDTGEGKRGLERSLQTSQAKGDTFSFSLGLKDNSGNRMSKASSIKPGEDIQVEVSLGEPTKKRLSEKRYEIISYIDGKFVAEEESGYTPYTCVIQTKGLEPGEHTVTINIATLTDRVGSKSIVVKLGK